MEFTNEAAIDLVKSTFDKINEARSTNEIEAIVEDDSLKKYKIHTDKYPKIEFSLTKSDIKLLRDNGFINDKHELTGNMSAADPLAKLLYALIWKNGDVKKIRHIIKGILHSEDTDVQEQEDRVVFYQFGRHLENKEEPIIDQHILRAFALYEPKEDVVVIRMRDTITREQKSLIAAYKAWLAGLKDKFKDEPSYAYYIDKVLFALGKAVKLKKK